MTLCWQALSATQTDYSVFVQLVGEANSIVGRRGTYPGLGSFPTSLWQPGDTFCDLYRVPVNGDAQGPAVYAVEVGLFDLQTNDRVPATDAAGNRVEFAGVADVKVTGVGAGVPASAPHVGANFADKASLLAYEANSMASNDELPLTLYWRAEAPLAADYVVFYASVGRGRACRRTGRCAAAGRALSHPLVGTRRGHRRPACDSVARRSAAGRLPGAYRPVQA